MHLTASRNGKVERWHRSIKSEWIRPGTPLSVEDAVRLIEGYVRHYNEVRLHSAIGYVTPTRCPVATKKSSLSGIASSRRPGLAGRNVVTSSGKLAELYDVIVNAIRWTYDG